MKSLNQNNHTCHALLCFSMALRESDKIDANLLKIKINE